MNEEELLTKLNKIDIKLQDLEEQKGNILNKIKIVTGEKENLQYQYNWVKIRNKSDASQWTETKFEWSDKVTKLLKEKFKFEKFRPTQLAAINATLSKKDVLLLMPTGGGKSLVYQLSALINKRLTLVISPCISLMENQLIALKNLDIEAAALNISSSKQDEKSVHDSMTSETSKLNLLYVTPEWVAKRKIFMTHLQNCFDKGFLDRIVIDEVHCCSIWGHDFHSEYNNVGIFKKIFPGVPILGLTATATTNVLADIQNMLSLTDALIFTAPFNRPNLFYKVIGKPTDNNKCLNILERLLNDNYKDQCGIIYSSTIKECEEISDGLKERGLNINCYHAKLDADANNTIHRRWLENKYQAVVTTAAFGIGIVKPDVRFVIHHCMPKSVEGLYQESGRAGRDGEQSDCIVMFNLEDFLKNVSMVPSKAEEENSKYILEYCLNQKRCRRAIMAEHFDEVEWDDRLCNKMCDHCKYQQYIPHYKIAPALLDILKLLELASNKKVKLTLDELIAGCFESDMEGLSRPKCSKEQAAHIVGFLIFKGYLSVEKAGYATVTYIQKGRHYNGKDAINMPCRTNVVGYEKVTGVLEVLFEKDEEPHRKRKRRDDL